MSDPVIEVPETAVESGERIARNSVLRSVGYVGGALLQFAAVVLAARYLGVAGFGNYTFIMAVAGVFQLLADMGVRNVVVRDLAVDPGSLKERLSIARTLLVIMSIVSLAGIVAAAYAMPVSTEVRDSLCIAGVAVLATFFGLGYSAVLRAQDRMASDILGFALHKLVMLAAMAVVVRTAWGLRGVFAAVLLANFVLFLYFRILVARSHGVTRLSRDLPAAWRLLRESFPLGVGEVLRRLTWQVDRLLLTAMGGPIAVGLFSIAYKFIEAMKPLADNMVLPLFPGFSRLARRSTSELFALHARGLKILYVLGCPAAYVLLTLSHRILKLFFGAAYLPACRRPRDPGAGAAAAARDLHLPLPVHRPRPPAHVHCLRRHLLARERGARPRTHPAPRLPRCGHRERGLRVRLVHRRHRGHRPPGRRPREPWAPVAAAHRRRRLRRRLLRWCATSRCRSWRSAASSGSSST